VSVSEGKSLRLSFDWQGDRYGHRLEWCQGDQVAARLEAVPGEPGEPWPPSPPLQQLSLQEGGDGQAVLLLVGMAGRSHWSMSVEPLAGRGWLFDVACRYQQVPAWL
jgi:hypothetical protein